MTKKVTRTTSRSHNLGTTKKGTVPRKCPHCNKPVIVTTNRDVVKPQSLMSGNI